MARHLLNALLPFRDRENWTADNWRSHMLSRATNQAERDTIIEMFRGQ